MNSRLFAGDHPDVNGNKSSDWLLTTPKTETGRFNSRERSGNLITRRLIVSLNGIRMDEEELHRLKKRQINMTTSLRCCSTKSPSSQQILATQSAAA
jgi:hypothetical protein